MLRKKWVSSVAERPPWPVSRTHVAACRALVCRWRPGGNPEAGLAISRGACVHAWWARTATPCQSSRQKKLEWSGVQTISKPVRAFPPLAAWRNRACG